MFVAGGGPTRLGASAAGCQTCAWCPSVAPGCQTCAWCPSVATGCQACARAHDPHPPRRVRTRRMPAGQTWASVSPPGFQWGAWCPGVATGCQACASAHDPHPAQRVCTRRISVGQTCASVSALGCPRCAWCPGVHLGARRAPERTIRTQRGATAPATARLHPARRVCTQRMPCQPAPGGLGDETPACIGFAWVRPGLGPPPSPAPAWASEEACAASPTVGSDPTGGPARDRLAWRPCRATGGRRGPSTRPSERATTG